jgi:hypothetical protein
LENTKREKEKEKEREKRRVDLQGRKERTTNWVRFKRSCPFDKQESNFDFYTRAGEGMRREVNT